VDRHHGDIESFSECDISEAGAYRYAEDISTFIWCYGWCEGAGPKNFWATGLPWPEDLLARIREHLAQWGGTLYHGDECPAPIREWFEAGKQIGAHNAGFERTMLNGHPGQVLGVPKTPIKQWMCTAAKSRAHGLPGALGEVAKALGTHSKNEAGRANMLMVCRPKKASKKDPSTMYTPMQHPEKFWELFLYNMDDVEAERAIDQAVPDLGMKLQQEWELDQLINDRGVKVDLDYVADARVVIAEYRAELIKHCLKITGCTCPEGEHTPKPQGPEKYVCPGFMPSQREKVAEYVRKNGYPELPNMQAETVEKALEKGSKIPDAAKKMLNIFYTYGMKAISKFDTMVIAACEDGRVRGMFIFCGAGTGRWSSVIIQLQNMARGVIKNVNFAIEVIQHRSLSWLRAMFS
jgi:DNA polymerase